MGGRAGYLWILSWWAEPGQCMVPRGAAAVAGGRLRALVEERCTGWASRLLRRRARGRAGMVDAFGRSCELRAMSSCFWKDGLLRACKEHLARRTPSNSRRPLGPRKSRPPNHSLPRSAQKRIRVFSPCQPATRPILRPQPPLPDRSGCLAATTPATLVVARAVSPAVAAWAVA